MMEISSSNAATDFLGGFADHDADDVGLAFEVGGACAVADGGDGHGRLRAE